MKPENPAQLSAKDIFILAAGLENAAERDAMLQEHSSTNPELLKQVQRLLAAADKDNSGSPLDAIVDAFGPKETLANPQSDGNVPLEVGGPIGRYRLMEQLGEGGMGVVYVAEQLEPVRRKVALKVIKPGMDSKQVIARFEAERQALALMDHTNIARVLDGGTTEQGLPYFVMELVRGLPITEYCDHAKATTRDRLALFIAVCNAVHHAHQKGIIHRDIKPGNVLVTLHDGKPVVKVIDFGIAKALHQQLSQNTIYTALNQVVGTPLYMSPEQLELSGLDIDTRTDIYSLGVLLYELLTGATPFDRERLMKSGFDEMRRIIREEDPPRPSQRITTLPKAELSTCAKKRGLDDRTFSKSVQNELDWITLKALEKDRNRRYESSSAFGADVQRYLDDETVLACPPNWCYRMGKWARRHKGMLSAGVMLLVAATIFSLLLWNERLMTLTALAGERDQRIVAVEQRQLAKDQEQLALHREAAAIESRQLAFKNQYNAEIVSGQVDLQRGYLRRLESKLRGHFPLGDQKDRRGWEWYYLWAVGHPEVRTLSAAGAQSFAAWSPDGRYIGSSGDIWDAATGQSLWRFDPAQNVRYRSAWSPDSQYFAWGTSSDDSCVYLWNRATDELHELRGHTESVWCLGWSPDSKQLISGGMDQTLRIWDIASREEVRSLQAPDYVSDVAFSPDGELITAAVKRRGVLVWQTGSGELLTELNADSGEVNNVQLSWRPDGGQLAVSTTQAWLLFRRDDWSLQRKQPLPSQQGRDIEWSRDGSKLAVADGQVISLWDPSAAEPERVLTGHTAPVLNVDWSPTNEQLVTSDNLGSVKIWDLNSSNNPALLSVDAELQSLAWTDDGDSLLLEHTDGGTSTWNIQQSGPIVRSASSASVEKSLWSPDRGLVVKYTDTDPAVVRIHKGKDDAVHAVCRLESEGKISQMAWSNDGTFLAIAQQLEKRVIVTMWDVDSEKRISKWTKVGPNSEGYLLKLVWSPDHQHLAVGALGEEGDDGTPIWQGHIYVLKVLSGACVLKHNVGGWTHQADIKAIAWRPDGHAIVAGTKLGLIEAISVDSETTLFSHPLNSTSIRSLSWNLDGDRIAAAADDGSVKILDANSGTDLLTFSLEGKPHQVAWSPNGRRLAAATLTGQVQVWDATSAYEWEENRDRRGELARSYAVAIAGESAIEREARLQKALNIAPDTLDTWMLRGNLRAAQGDFEGAAAEYSKAVDRNRKRSQSAVYSYGIALLGSRQFDAFRKNYSAMLNDLNGSTQSPSLKRNFIRLTMLIPQVGLDPEISIELARGFVKNYGASNAPAKLVLGTCLYRGSKFQEAADILAEAAAQLELQGNSVERPDLANALCVLAMTRYQLGHHFQANRMLEQSLNIAEKLPSDTSWTIVVPLQVLQREARGLIQDGPIGGEKQKSEAGK